MNECDVMLFVSTVGSGYIFKREAKSGEAAKNCAIYGGATLCHVVVLQLGHKFGLEGFAHRYHT